MMYDTIIVGGGPAGLSAALILGRCMRKVLVFDHGRPRNAYSHNLHGFLSQHNISPAEFLEKSRAQLKHFDTVKIKNSEVSNVKSVDNYFEVTTIDNEIFTACKLLLATGVVDELPHVDGIEKFYGKSVFQCPYCDAWEFRNKSLAVLGESERGVNLALMLKTWSSDIVLCTNGKYDLTAKQIIQLRANQIEIEHKRIVHLEGRNGNLKCIHFHDGSEIGRDAIFFNTPSFIRSKLLDQLGCSFTNKSGVPTGKYEATEIPGLYVAGNMTRDVQLMIVAAAEGAQAAFGINNELANERLKVAEIPLQIE